MKRFASFLIFLAAAHTAFAQDFSLEEAWRSARTNYPLIKKYDLIKKSTDYSLQNANKAYLPQFSIGGQATYQSDVTRIPANIPGVKEISKDQYKLQGELSQLLYDGGTSHAQKEIVKAGELAQLQNIEVNMLSVKERVTDIYFGILLLEEQLAQNKIRRETLSASLKKAEAAYANGTSYKSNVNELQAELLNVDMNAKELSSDNKAFRDMLGLLTGKTIDENTRLSKPVSFRPDENINRPELKLFDLQKSVYDAQKKKLQADWMPRLSAFVQGGYGRPGLNMLDNNFNLFAMGGLRLAFPINNLYNWKNNVKMTELNKRQLDTDKEIFMINTKTTLQKQLRDQEKFTALLGEDDKIIALRQEVMKAAEAQLDNQVITVSEFINKLNAANLASQTKFLHELQLLKSIYTYQNAAGN